MNKGVIAVVFLVACAMAAAFFYMAGPNKGLKAHKTTKDWLEFTKWQIKYGKEYDDENDISMRFGVFIANKHTVETHNAQVCKNYTLAVNGFADLTVKEFKETYFGLTPRTNSQNRYVPRRVADENLPDSIDWVSKGAVTPVKDQGQCGSCWAFSTVGSLEGAYFQAKGQLLSFSEQQLVDCSRSFGNQGCNGGLMDQGFQYLEQYKIELESDYPYTARDGRCRYDASKGVTGVSGYSDIDPNEAALKEASSQRVVSVAVDANTWQLYGGGIMDNCGTSLDHGVTLTGYGERNGDKYWRIKNSWNTWWGEDGYIRLSRTDSRSSTGTCGLASQASYPEL